ncbi:uncharacterized protein TRIADDRAFT_56401 [Trichoplax adhaerens]|uniref:RRM domain-containing protein n=1 Tax=Trichoplax adhaerens TaxID=10228 RepID=B3RY12_TRIAD|nr:hypothetical protein TRIADDRAFT_56401 [Trichoplax adhaerens]EDV24522.1 hypothetical protein TRIADDRAFT_56401 [Trichoplax adhaerens]|eukprot:XP_002112412.1 hypothetical protein TRIADDRAFT_56401 [Trichoplax adhaerens]
MQIERRVFIGGLHQDVTEDDIKRCFRTFGDIRNVEIKVKTNASGGRPNTFAYLDISITDKNFERCLSTYNKARWKGNHMRLQLAKDNFLCRLNSERDDIKKTSIACESDHPQRVVASKEGDETGNTYDRLSPGLKMHRKDRKHVINCSFEKAQNTRIIFDNARSTDYENSLRDISVIELTWNIIKTAKGLEDKSFDHNHETPRESNSNSIINKYRKASVLSDDKLISRMPHTVTLQSDVNGEERISAEITQVSQPTVEGRIPLFDHSSDEESNDSDRFKVRPHLEGNRGQRLLDLQKTYHGDARFKLDDRFLEDDVNSTYSHETSSDARDAMYNDDNGTSPSHFKNERQQMLEVLQGMVGNIAFTGVTSNVSSGSKKMKRYDPNDKSHSIYEFKKEESTDMQNIQQTKTDLNDNIAEKNQSSHKYSNVIPSLGEYFSGGSKADTSPFIFTSEKANRSFDDAMHVVDSKLDEFSLRDITNEANPQNSECKSSIISWSSCDEVECSEENERAQSPTIETKVCVVGPKMFFCMHEDWTKCSRLRGM